MQESANALNTKVYCVFSSAGFRHGLTRNRFLSADEIKIGQVRLSDFN
jgi:hypothetical protein